MHAYEIHLEADDFLLLLGAVREVAFLSKGTNAALQRLDYHLSNETPGWVRRISESERGTFEAETFEAPCKLTKEDLRQLRTVLDQALAAIPVRSEAAITNERLANKRAVASSKAGLRVVDNDE